MKLVIDTNVYLAAMGKHESFCYLLIVKILKNKHDFEIFISPSILKELEKKARELASKKIIEPQYLNRLMFLVKGRFEIIDDSRISLNAVERDPSDNKIIECAIAASAHLIITMDKDLLKLKSFRGCGIIHPKTFLHILPKL